MKVSTSNKEIMTMRGMKCGKLYEIVSSAYAGIIVTKYADDLIVNLSEPGDGKKWESCENKVVECNKGFSITLTQD